MKMVTPFSWALSGKDKGLTTIMTENDVECAKWLIYESNQDLHIVADSNGLFMLSGYTELLPDTWLQYGREDRLHIMMNMPKLEDSYLFLSEGNTEYQEYVYCSDVGLRGQTPFEIKGNLFKYKTHDVDAPWEIIEAVAVIEEVYRSGDAVVYQQRRCVKAQ